MPETLDGVLGAALLRLSADGNDSERCLAVKALQVRGGYGSVETLIHLLRDPDPDVRADAAQALATTGVGPDSGTILIENVIEDPIGENKVHCIRTLAALGIEGIAPLFLELVAGRGESVTWEDDDGGWDDWLDVQLACLEVLPQVVPKEEWDRAVEAVLTALADEEGQDVTALAYRVLARLGEHGAAALASALPGASPLQRKRIAKALTEAQRDAASDMLAHLLADEDTQIRIAALTSAAHFGLAELCARAFDDSAPEVRAVAVDAAGWDDRSLLKKALRDISPAVRRAACKRIADLGRKMPSMGLTLSVQKNLRSGNTSLIAALIEAACVAEPDRVGNVLEDIVNHPASAVDVRCAALRALGQLQTPHAAALCAKAASDTERTVRAEAVHALGQIASSGGRQSDAARATLASAIAGSLVKVPEDWQPDYDKVVSFPPRKGAQAAGDEGDTHIRIDREGNIVEMPAEAPSEGDDGGVETATGQAETRDRPEDAVMVETSAPTSTLAAILSFEPPRVMTEEAVELEDEDLDFLEMASGGARKRKIDPQSSEPAHIDVRRFAVRAALRHPHADYVEALCFAAEDHDVTLAATALDALGAIREADVSIAAAEAVLLRLAEWTNPDVKARAVAQLGALESPAAASCLARCLDGETDPHTLSEALLAASQRADMDPDIEAFIVHEHPRVRSMAARIIFETVDNHSAVDALLRFAQTGHSDHHLEAARILSGHEDLAAQGIADWIEGDDAQLRHKAIEMIGVMWSHGAGAKTPRAGSIS